MTTNTKLYNYSFSSAKTYLFALMFIAGNLVLPQLAHLIPNGGPTLLPIYFFTLIAAYKFGFRTGLLTAVLSPVLNHLIFGMPVLTMLPIILIKSTLLALAASYAAHYFKKVSLLSLVIVVLSYQFVGTLAEWLIVQNFSVAIQDFRMGWLGMVVQVLGGYLILKLRVES
ncbi:MAG: ECF transporter S component [Paludibacter sp.]|nr:ECF transporter S component [Paludibacter sp.]